MRSTALVLLLATSACGVGDTLDLETQISPAAREAVESLISKSWSFTPGYGAAALPDKAAARNTTTQTTESRPIPLGCTQVVVSDFRVPSGLAYEGATAQLGNNYYAVRDADGHFTDSTVEGGSFDADIRMVFDQVLILPAVAPFHQYILGRSTDGTQAVWDLASSDLIHWPLATKITDSFPWSLTAALTPGAHHVRLYLETEGKIETILSKKDNFTDFYESDIGDVRFFDLAGSRVHGLTLRDPNVTQNDAGVYALTWDNRGAKVGPGSREDPTALSDTFGLAFSVDGLDWTVYSNEMTIEGLPRVVYQFQYEGVSGTCDTTATGRVRHVVPLFITDDQIRLYFTTEHVRGGQCRQGTGTTCATATAISN